jgi:hypothetical protein
MSNYRMIRIGLLVAVIVGGLIFHHQGHAYDVIRGVYIVLILGFLVWRLALRTGRTPRSRNRDLGPPPPPAAPPPAPPSV